MSNQAVGLNKIGSTFTLKILVNTAEREFLEGWPVYTLLSNKALKQIVVPGEA